jgi:hypothetical protein
VIESSGSYLRDFLPRLEWRGHFGAARCKVANYLRIWAAPRKLSANGSTLFVNGESRSVMPILNTTKSQVAGQ